MRFLISLVRVVLPFLVIPAAAAGVAIAVPFMWLDHWALAARIVIAIVLFAPLLYAFELLGLLFLIPAAMESVEEGPQAEAREARKQELAERYRNIPDGTGRRQDP